MVLTQMIREMDAGARYLEEFYLEAFKETDDMDLCVSQMHERITYIELKKTSAYPSFQKRFKFLPRVIFSGVLTNFVDFNSLFPYRRGEDAEALPRYDGFFNYVMYRETIQEQLALIFKYIQGESICAWNGIMHFYKNLSTLNAFELGVSSNTNLALSLKFPLNARKERKNHVAYLLGADDIKVNKQIYNYTIYQGTHGFSYCRQADLILPTSSPWSSSNLYVNYFGMYNYAKKINTKLLNAKSHIFYAMRIFDMLTPKKFMFKEFGSIIPFHSIFSSERFRLTLLNRALGAFPEIYVFLNPLQYIRYDNSRYKYTIFVLQSLLEKPFLIDFMNILTSKGISKLKFNDCYTDKDYSFSNLEVLIKHKELDSLNLGSDLMLLYEKGMKRVLLPYALTQCSIKPIRLILPKKYTTNIQYNKANIKLNYVEDALHDSILRSSSFLTLSVLRLNESKNNFAHYY
jgi:hypothetical protein